MLSIYICLYQTHEYTIEWGYIDTGSPFINKTVKNMI